MKVQSQPLAGKSKRVARKAKSDIPPPHRCTLVTSSTAIPPIPKNYTFRQLDTNGVTIAGVVGSVAGGAFQFNLNSLSNAAAFVALFDQYRIRAIRLTFLPRTNVVSGTAYNPPLYTVIDYDDTATLGTRSAMTQRDCCTVTQVYESLQRTFTPHIAVAAYSGTFTSYANEVAPWLDCGSPSIQHYGLKWFIDSCATPAPLWDVEIEYWIEFRNVI